MQINTIHYKSSTNMAELKDNIYQQYKPLIEKKIS